MRIVAINEAEAIIEPFFDGGTSEPDNQDPRYHVLDEYQVQVLNGAIGSIRQGWAFATIQLDKAAGSLPALEMHRSCRLDISDYDRFIFFGSLPKDFRLTVKAVVDGKEQILIKEVQGTGVSEEYTGTIQGCWMTGLSIQIVSSRGGIEGNICWLGLAHSERLQRMLKQREYYSPEWPGCFVQDIPACPKPTIGILLGAEELEALREKLRHPLFADAYAKKKEQAQRDMAICPEHYIGRFVPHFDQRWNRTRDRAWAPSTTKNACGLETVIENLAFVGLVENDLEMMRMAVRHALSVCHCEYWCESAMGVLPGATWHHRSFTENMYCKVISLVLDWCGDLMTPFAKQIVRDALAMKGLPRIESDFRRVEYIRYMNQGIVFSYGRIFADLAMLPRHPRYRRDLLQAEEDLHSIIENYIQEDGGTLEGPGYWMFTFNETLCALYAMARYHQKPFDCYRDLLSKTSQFELSMLSMEKDETVYLPINDAHPLTRISCALANSFYLFTGHSAWKNLYERLLRQGSVDEDSFALISAPIPDGEQLEEQEVCRIYPVTGQLGTVRKGRDLTTHIHLCSGPTYAAHFHEDKGSLILEAEGICLCPDCGSANYFESELFYLRQAGAHNLLYPVRADGILSAQGRYEKGGRVLKAQGDGTRVEFCTDDTLAWSDGVYQKVRRTVISPFAELLALEDEFLLGNADSVEFRLNCYGQWKVEADCAYAQVGDVKLYVKPLNWKWQGAAAEPMMDGEHRPVWQLRAPYQEARGAKLVTAVWMERQNRIHICEQKTAWEFSGAEGIFYLDK